MRRAATAIDGVAQVQRYDAQDRTSEAAWVAAAVERFGRIDAIVANAGIMIPKTVIEAEDEDLDALLEVNVKSPLRLVRAAWPQLVACGRGRVVTIVSLSGLRVKTPRSGLYSVSKFAALALTHAVRQTGWDEGVRAVAVCPGFVVSDMSAAVTDRPPDTMTQPDDLARIVGLRSSTCRTRRASPTLPDQFHLGGKLVIVLVGPGAEPWDRKSTRYRSIPRRRRRRTS